jgi:hypothetical protein
MVQCSNWAHNMIRHSYGLINLGDWLFLLYGDLWSGYRTEWTVCVWVLYQGTTELTTQKGFRPKIHSL